MKITKFVHSCLLVEMPEPTNRTALFDPGTMSEAVLDVDALEFLDDIFITHKHADHVSVPLIQKLVAKFPNVRVTAPPEVVESLQSEGIANASAEAPDGVKFFDAPHESIEPLFPSLPQEIGVHYLGKISHPGDSHSFHETMPILALPVQAPWGSMLRAVKLALELRPQYIVPIHDWHWSDEARTQTYDNLEQFFAGNGVTFFKPETGKPIVVEI